MPKSIPILPSSSAAASAFPKSLPVSKMLKLGKVITDVKRQYEEIDIYTFDINHILPMHKKFKVEKEAYGSGSFRVAYKAKSYPDDGKCYIVKKYTKETVDSLGELKETPESHARKSVQMHMLAKNLAFQFCQCLNKAGVVGDTFTMRKLFLEK